MAEIRLEGVTKRYGDLVALDDVSLVIEDGSFTSIFGPPNSGKSVLLRVLLGLEPLDAGRVLVDGKDVTHATPNARNLSMVFQNLALFPHLNARDNMAFPMVRRGATQEDIDRRLEQLSGVLSIGHILHKRPAALSGGERQRVAIGRALIRDASAYMMDEPIAALDARLRDAMRVELKRLQTELGRTFIYVTHDCEEAMSVADTMAILENGRIVQQGRPDDIYTRPETLYVARLVGSPGINVLAGQARNNWIDLAMGRIGAPVNAGAVTVALRPEALRVTGPGDGELLGTISDIERLGGFSVLTVSGGDEIRAISTADIAHGIGDEVGLTVDPLGLHLFDPQGGTRIG